MGKSDRYSHLGTDEAESQSEDDSDTETITITITADGVEKQIQLPANRTSVDAVKDGVTAVSESTNTSSSPCVSSITGLAELQTNTARIGMAATGLAIGSAFAVFRKRRRNE